MEILVFWDRKVITSIIYSKEDHKHNKKVLIIYAWNYRIDRKRKIEVKDNH